MSIRPLLREDKEPIEKLLRATDMFREEEIVIALELIEICLEDAQQKDYEIYSFVDDAGSVKGYVCVGPTPSTNGTYDLYWIAVVPSEHGKGIGSRLLQFAEDHVRSKGGRLMIAETSSLPKYEQTRSFYERKGFDQRARIKEYYSPDDDLIIYGKKL
ncbi:MAG TPA: GNAT family N-acetyltransferase [Bacteroidota bacterium]|nr:GNAT family N-acetyltransferase [Bacteroidota bacterium]